MHYSMLRLYRHALSRVQIKVLKDKCGVDHSNDIVLQLYSQSGFSSKGIPQFQLRASKPLQLAKLGIGGWIEFRNLTTLFKSFVNISDNSTGSRLVDLRLAVQCLSVNPASLGLLFGSARERPQLVEFTENEMQKEMIFPKSMTLLASSQLQEQQQQQRRKRSVLTTAEEPTAVSSVPPDNSSEIAQTQGLPTLPSNYDSIKCTLYHHEVSFCWPGHNLSFRFSFLDNISLTFSSFFIANFRLNLMRALEFTVRTNIRPTSVQGTAPTILPTSRISMPSCSLWPTRTSLAQCRNLAVCPSPACYSRSHLSPPTVILNSE